jgi:hypothetical protein
MSTKTKKEHYVSNKEFLAAMIEYRKAVKSAQRKKLEKPPVSNYIGECFLKIANHLYYRPNFINYTFRDDMISDGIENCLQYLDNFNPDKSNNPFAYFTQIIYYAFIRRIQKEKKQTIIKHKILTESNMDDYALMPGHDREFKNQFTEFLKKNIPMVESDSDKKKSKVVSIKTAKVKKTRRRSSKASLDFFIQ